MFSSQFNIPKQHYRVDNYPTVDELNKYIEKASEVAGIKHCFYWVDTESSEQFTLSIHFHPKGGAPEWWMHETTPLGEKMLWFYRTEDLSVVYPQILEAVGAPNPFEDEEEVEIDGTLTSQLHAQSSAYATPGAHTRHQKEMEENKNKPPVTKLLSGDLSLTAISSILETAAKESATGRILIKGPAGDAMIQLVHGQPVHAFSPLQEGLEALLELFTWKQGNISFMAGTKPDKNTIKMPIDQILYKGAKMVDDISFLQEHKIDEQAILRRAQGNLSEKDFENAVLQGPPLGLELQKNFYKNIDSQRTLQDIATFLSLSPSQWISITSNLIKLELLMSPSGTTGVLQQSPNPQPSNMPPLPGTESGQPQQLADLRQSPNVQDQGVTFDRKLSNIQNQSMTFDRQSQNVSKQGMTVDKHFANPSEFQKSNQVPDAISDQGDTLDRTFAKPATEVKKAKLPPPGAFKVQATGPKNLDEAQSPAVAAFMSSSTTSEIPSTLQIGIQEEEVRHDPSQSKAVWTAITNRETGILTLEAFQMFLEIEFNRAFKKSSNLALVVFSMKFSSSSQTKTGSAESARQVINAIKKIKSDIDYFGHFGNKGYGLLIPDANSSNAVQLVDRITTNLTKFAPNLASNRPTIYFGIASVPSDAQNVASLMNSAQVSMLEAAKRNVTRIQFTELRR